MAIIYAPCQKDNCATADQGHCRPHTCTHYLGDGPLKVNRETFQIRFHIRAYHPEDGEFTALISRRCIADNREEALRYILDDLYQQHPDFVWSNAGGTGSGLFLIYRCGKHYLVRARNKTEAQRIVSGPSCFFVHIEKIPPK